MTGSTAPNLCLTSPHPSFLSSKIKTDHKIRRMGSQRWVSGRLGRLTADVHHKLCGKQTCTLCNQTAKKSSRPLIRKLDCFRSRTSYRPNAFSPAILSPYRFPKPFAPSRDRKKWFFWTPVQQTTSNRPTKKNG